MGAWIASQKLIIGVTSSALLVNKPNAHLVEPLDERMRHVRDFLRLFKKGLELQIVELSDVYGPTGYDPNVQALVVSKETLSGAKQSASPSFITRLTRSPTLNQLPSIGRRRTFHLSRCL